MRFRVCSDYFLPSFVRHRIAWTSATFSLVLLMVMLGGTLAVEAGTVELNDVSLREQIRVQRCDAAKLSLRLKPLRMVMRDVDINGQRMQHISIPGVLLPRDAGHPDLPAISHYVAIPHGATVTATYRVHTTREFSDVMVSPAPVIPLDTDRSPLRYEKNERLYGSGQLFPEEPLIVSKPMFIRGVQTVIVSFTPFRFNPQARTLTVLSDVEIDLDFEGGNGQYGNSRHRSRFFEPMLQQLLVNYDSLVKLDADASRGLKSDEYEYVIICPDDADFIAAAGRLRDFRTKQGISTGIFTLTQTGSSATEIKTFIHNAYSTWSITPVAVLLMSDYPSSGKAYGITSPVYSGSYGSFISDNVYADVDNDRLPDVNIARLTAQDAGDLQIMIDKLINYETSPITDSSFYNNPLMAGGWQSDRWFILCTEIVYGFMENVLGKSPLREYAGASSAPSTWSTNSNTSLLINYFGPNGLGYIPATPAHLTNWGGNATGINTAINNGTFLVLHRDHGDVDGWSDPAYTNSSLAGLNNENRLPFVFSINCLTGKFNSASTSFVEAFHRMNAGTLGMIGATEVSYSFVNDAYVFGLFDSMWPEFDPGNDFTPQGRRHLQPGFANVSGKYYLEASNWPSNPSNKRDTQFLFHMHGDPFTTLYSEVPQQLSIVHDAVQLAGLDFFSITADEGALIGLTVDSQLIGRAEGTGSPISIPIDPQLPPAEILVTVTKANYYRYEATLQVIPPDGPYVIYSAFTIDDSGENNNGQADYNETFDLDFSVKNVGNEDAANVTVSIAPTAKSGVSILDDTHVFGLVAAGQTVNQASAFSMACDGTILDMARYSFDVTSQAGDGTTWNSRFSLTVHAPEFELTAVTIDDSAGNNNGRFDPGETVIMNVALQNTGSADAHSLNTMLSTTTPMIFIDNPDQVITTLTSQQTTQLSFTVAAPGSFPSGNFVPFSLDIVGVGGFERALSFSVRVGKVFALIWEPDPTPISGAVISSFLQRYQRSTLQTATLPAELSDYEIIYVLLGIYSQNHRLTAAEGQALATYLDNGGRIYMEGGDTWYYDTKTTVHPYFNITGLSDGSSDLSQIVGVPGTFTANFVFGYNGGNGYIDRLQPAGTAFTILRNQSPLYDTGICYDGGTYRTIGASHEIGGLQGAQRDQLLKEILYFFGFNEYAVPALSPLAMALCVMLMSALVLSRRRLFHRDRRETDNENR